MHEYSLAEIVKEYEGYTKRYAWYFYPAIALIIASYFLSSVLPPVVFFIYFFAFSLNRVYTNIRFYKWLYRNHINTGLLVHSFRTKKLVESTYAINSCIRWAMPADKSLLRSVKTEIEENLSATHLFNEEIYPETDYLIYREAGAWLRIVLIISGFCLVVSYANAGQKYLLHITLISILLLVPSYIFYLRRKKTPYMIISDSGIQTQKKTFIQWKEIKELYIVEDSDSESTDYTLKMHLRNGDIRDVDVSDVTTDLGVLEIDLKKRMQNLKKRK